MTYESANNLRERVSTHVLQILNVTSHLNASDIAKISGFKKKQIYHSVNYLKSKNKIKNTHDYKYYITPNNEPASNEDQSKVKDSPKNYSKQEILQILENMETLKTRSAELRKNFEEFHEKYEELKTKHTNEVIDHLNSKAVIAYLEKKLELKPN
jgi:hypothetical protein